VQHLAVDRFVSPEEFAELERKALTCGFLGVASGPFVRSSYQADSLYQQAVLKRKQHAHEKGSR
jgi:lipoic acid synthetase